MKKWMVICGLLFAVVGLVTLSFSPDMFSLIIVLIMCGIITAGFFAGIFRSLSYTDGMRTARKFISQRQDVVQADHWMLFQKEEVLFHNKALDALWMDYRDTVNRQQEDGVLRTPVEQMINEESLSLRSWQSVVLQIPGTLTALGLLGTFLGLIMGISGIAFSTVEAALSSISMLLNGIEIAFYTSIAGVVFSILFNISYKLVWNMLLRELGMFVEDFHKYVLPDEEEQNKQSRQQEFAKVMECLERIPRTGAFYHQGEVANTGSNANNEQRLMSEIWEGLKKGDFIFFLQPLCNLQSKELVGGEALMRWNHNQLGIVSPMVFLPLLERNGYIVKLDRYIWEEVCKTIRGWLDTGIRPVPISVNVSKLDILGMDIAQFFSELIKKYELAPHYLSIEIAEDAYLQCTDAVYELEKALRGLGFRVIVDGYTGAFSAMNTLHETQADMMKLDLQHLEEAQELDGAIIGELFEQARKSRIKMIATGIENMKHLTLLRKAGCLEGQGYFLHKPLPLEQFEKLMENGEDML